MQIYCVTAKCGHVGKNYFIPITFAIRAENGREAAAIVRQYPRVKHHHKDAILDVRRINEAEESKILYLNHCDPYLKCTNIQQQRSVIEQIACRIQQETVVDNSEFSKKNITTNIGSKRKKSRVDSMDLWNEYLNAEDAYAS